MKDYGTNTRHLMDALTVMGLRVKELEIREAERLNEENSKLKAQLTWRPATQKPDVDGLYVVTKRDESTRWDKSYHLVRFKNGEWKVDSFSGGYVYSYFNVPIPEPNEE